MKKVFRSFSYVLFVVCLLTLLSIVAFAQESNNDGGLKGPTNLFIEVCDNLFAENSNYRAIDKNGFDVTESFLSAHQAEYNSRNYMAIWNSVKGDLSVISWTVESLQPYLLMSGSVSESFYVLGETTDHMPGKTFEMTYTISGTYRYHDSTGQISECSDAVLDITRFDAGALFSYKQFATSTNSRISNDKKSVTFSARFSITLSYSALNGPGITWWTEDFGPYSNSVTGRV